MSVVICDIYSPTGNQVMVEIVKRVINKNFKITLTFLNMLEGEKKNAEMFHQ